MYDVFSLPPIQFPPGFLWGSATAGHQIEGDNIHSQNWHAEQQESFWADDPQHVRKAPSGKAADGYRLYREDVDLLAALGHRAYRLSIEWSRIEPAEGEWNPAALDHYVDLLERLVARGIQPFITLHHFTHPLWFERLGGFRRPDNRRYWERYLEYLLPRVGQYAGGWTVINEFNLWGGYSPAATAEAGPFKFNMLRAHALGYHLIKRYSAAPVSSAHAFIHWFPRRYHDDLDRRMTDFADFVTNEFFFHALRTGELVYPGTNAEHDPDVKGTMDFWAVNYYTRHMVDARLAQLDGRRFQHKQLKLIPMDFYLEEFYPEGLIANLERLADRPVYITENGLAADDDRFRIVYLALTFSALREALDRGVDLRGYFYWSLLDNYEWGTFIPRFGLVAVDPATFERRPKPSAAFYREVIERNGLDADLLRRYLTELPTRPPAAAPAVAPAGSLP
ncbi:MAG: family 1 glycosylhydrolase [Anaerolineales bacterium]